MPAVSLLILAAVQCTAFFELNVTLPCTCYASLTPSLSMQLSVTRLWSPQILVCSTAPAAPASITLPTTFVKRLLQPTRLPTLHLLLPLLPLMVML